MKQSWEEKWDKDTSAFDIASSCRNPLKELVRVAIQQAIAEEQNAFKKILNSGKRMYEIGRLEAIQECIDLSDKIEESELDGGTEQWRALKCFRNTMREKIIHKEK